jgi:hypothetical protein
MDSSFEAVLRKEVDISMHSGSVIVPRGLYVVTIMYDERGRKDGAQLSRIDPEGETPVRLSQAHFEMLDGTAYFERRG